MADYGVERLLGRSKPMRASLALPYFRDSNDEQIARAIAEIGQSTVTTASSVNATLGEAMFEDLVEDDCVVRESRVPMIFLKICRRKKS